MKSSLAIFYANVATAVGALVLACAPASAASYAAGTLSEGVPYTFESGVDGIGTGSPLPGVTFSDNVTFTLATTQGLTSQIDYSNFADEAVISGLAVKLFRSGSAAPLFQGIDGTPGDLVTNRFVAASLSPGDYILVVSGAGSGLSGGWYTGAIGAVPPGGASLGAVAAVPELPGWASMFLGLAMIGTLLRRRSLASALAPIRA